MQSVIEILGDETLTTSERVEKVFIEAPARAIEEVKKYITASIAKGLEGHIGDTEILDSKMSDDGTFTCPVALPAWLAAAATSVNVPMLATEVEPAGIAAIAAQLSYIEPAAAVDRFDEEERARVLKEQG